MIVHLGWKLIWSSEDHGFWRSWEKNGQKILNTFRKEYAQLKHAIFFNVITRNWALERKSCLLVLRSHLLQHINDLASV